MKLSPGMSRPTAVIMPTRAPCRAAAPPPDLPNPATRQEDLRAEVDRILDKINSDGFGALTTGERRVLDEAKNLLSRR